MRIGIGLHLSGPIRRGASGTVYTRTAFVFDGAPGGTLNDHDDPYSSVVDAITALSLAYPGESWTVIWLVDSSQGMTGATIETLQLASAITFKMMDGATTWSWSDFNYVGADGSVAGENGGSITLPPITFDGVISPSTLNIYGGNGQTGAAQAQGGNGGSSNVTINLLNGSVIANIDGHGGNGAAGGDGDGGSPSGSGGDGGDGCTINHDATSSATTYNVNGGTAGDPGADNGGGAGAAGAAGVDGSYNLIP